MLIARIASIEPFPHKYVFHCRDDSIEKADIEVSMLKIAMGRITYYQNRGSVTTHSFNKHKTTLEELSCLQFETLPNVGVPYFKFYLKLSRLYNGHQEEAGRVRWHVESMERVTDYNELTYHFSKMMAYELLSLN